MQKLCSQDPSGKGEHCFCVEIDPQRGVKKCCKCNQWNVQGNDWTNDEDFRWFQIKNTPKISTDLFWSIKKEYKTK